MKTDYCMLLFFLIPLICYYQNVDLSNKFFLVEVLVRNKDKNSIVVYHFL